MMNILQARPSAKQIRCNLSMQNSRRIGDVTTSSISGNGGPAAALRVLHVSACVGGGVPQAILDHVRATPDQQHHVLWPASNDEVDADGVAATYALPKSPLKALARIKSTIRAVRPDIVIAHSSVAGVLTRLLPQTGFIVIYQPHGYAFEAPHRPTWQRNAIRRIEAFLAGRAITLIGITPRELQLSKDLGARDVTWVPNCSHACVPCDSQSPVSKSDGIRVVTAGRIVPQKDPEFFARVARAVTMQDPRITFTWIGDGDAALRKVLVASGVTVTGWRPPETAWQLMHSSSLYVHTAAYEGFPLTVADAAMLGLPLALRQIPAFDGYTREPICQASQMAEFILKFAHDDGATQMEARGASRRVAAACAPEAQQRQLQELYSRVSLQCTRSPAPV